MKAAYVARACALSIRPCHLPLLRTRRFMNSCRSLTPFGLGVPGRGSSARRSWNGGRREYARPASQQDFEACGYLGEEITNFVFVGGAAIAAWPLRMRWPLPAEARVLPTGRTVRVATTLALAATKMEAFLSRGGGGHLSSHDLEDVFSLLVGDPDLIDQISDGSEEVHSYLRSHLRRICTDPISSAELQGHFASDAASQRRGAEVLRRLRALPGD